MHSHELEEIKRLLDDQYLRIGVYIMTAIDDLTAAITGLQTAVTDAIANAGNVDHHTDDTAIESAVTTINAVVAQLNSALPASTPAPVPTPTDTVTASCPVSSTPPL